MHPKLEEIFSKNPEALDFLTCWNQYVHMIDDIIDEPEKRNDNAFILRAFAQAALTFSRPFWLKYGSQLVMMDHLINNQYADSIVWEKKVDWRKEHGEALSHAGYDMMYAVIWIVAGYDAMREISLERRENIHFEHLEHKNNNHITNDTTRPGHIRVAFKE